MHILIGLIGVIVSGLILVYRVPIHNFMGQIRWAEDKLGPGGTYTVLLLTGIALFFISLIIMTDSVDLLFGDRAEKAGLFDALKNQ